MQIARQVYGLNTANNAIIFFKDGSPAYITKRFDVKDDGSKWGIEDFATLAGKTKDNAGDHYKYSSNYEEVGQLIRQYVSAWRIEIEKYFSLVLFNFLFSNGDAHLKNFALIESSGGDYLLSPAYDLINTRLHVNDTDFALDKGLFSDDFKSKLFKKSGHPCKKDFIEFAKRIGVAEGRVLELLHPFLEKQSFIETLLRQSFLNDSARRGYLVMYNTKRNYLIAE